MDMAPELLCDAGLGLALGLAIGGSAGRSEPAAAVTSHHRRKESAPSVNPAPNEPFLTLSLLDDVYGADPGGQPAVLPKAETSKGPRVSPPHSTVSSFSATAYTPQGVKREKDAAGGDEAEVEKASSRASEEEEDGGARKKLRLTKEQSALLEDRFKEHSTLNPKQKQALAKQLNLRPRQVEVWFQNRRARTKLKQTEVDCEFLKRCCETLTEENRRLHKELQELRTLKFAPPPLYMQFPAATLTICPSCEKLGAAAAAAANGPKAAPPPKPHFFNPFTHPAAC